MDKYDKGAEMNIQFIHNKVIDHLTQLSVPIFDCIATKV